MPYKDPIKQKEYLSKHYQENKDKYQVSSLKAKRNRAKWFREFKQTLKCSVCGETRWQVLDFHHPNERVKKRKSENGTLIRYSISYLVGHNGKEKILEAIQDCIVLCANCHRMSHWSEEEEKFI